MTKTKIKKYSEMNAGETRIAITSKVKTLLPNLNKETIDKVSNYIIDKCDNVFGDAYNCGKRVVFVKVKEKIEEFKEEMGNV